MNSNSVCDFMIPLSEGQDVSLDTLPQGTMSPRTFCPSPSLCGMSPHTLARTHEGAAEKISVEVSSINESSMEEQYASELFG